MKYLDYNIGNDKIEFLNSILGKETVIVNGKITSEKFSIIGTNHNFKINDNNFILKSNYELFMDRKLKIELVKNEVVIDSKFIEIHKRQRVLWITFGFVIVYVLIKYL